MRLFTLTLALAAAAGLSCALSVSSARAGGGADAHAPIGVMGDHMHHAGEFMLSYRYMTMRMDGNRDGTDSLSETAIATTVPNRFAGVAGQPPTLRVVPETMRMDMQMFGAMYAPTNWVTLTAMAPFLDKEMRHVTYMGAAGTAIRGHFTTKNSGWGDVRVGGLFRLYDGGGQHVHLNAGLSLPTGSLDATGTVLAPNGATPTLRLPYAMQLGTGTYDLLPGLTYTGHSGPWGWGGQAMAEIRLQAENSQGYAWGDKYTLTGWADYQWAPWISTSARLTGTAQGAIDGIDPQILAPVQTADPAHYGGRTLNLALGVNLLGQSGFEKGHRLAIEAGAPLYRDLNGPQLETDWTVTVGWQYAF